MCGVLLVTQFFLLLALLHAQSNCFKNLLGINEKAFSDLGSGAIVKAKKIVNISLEIIFWIVVIWLIIQGNRIVDRIIEPTNVNSDIPSDASFRVFVGIAMMIFFAYIIKRLLKFVANIFLKKD